MEIIHIVLGKANPERMNGVNKVVYQLATHQTLQGRKTEVWGITRDLTHNYGERNFTTRLFAAGKNPFAMDKDLQTALLARKTEIVVHLHGGWIPQFSSISAFLQRHRIPFVITPHGAYNTVAMRRSAFLKKVYFHFFEKKLLQRAAKIHAIGQSEEKGLARIFKHQNSFLQPYGFEGNTEIPFKKAANQPFIVGFVGRIDLYTKGLDLLAHAYRKFIMEGGNNSRLWIVGNGPDMKALEQLVQQLGIAERVVFWGMQQGEQKMDLIRQMDVFVHPSRNEGLPTAVLEAAQSGVPCIVSAATNMAETIRRHEAGRAIPDEDIPALTEALLQMSEAWETGQNHAANARKMVTEVFDWQRIIPAFDALYSI